MLKDRIADKEMWTYSPQVAYRPRRKLLERLEENDPLFTFIDTYMSDLEFEFEPIMEDGRFVCLPYDCKQQGFGICVSRRHPGLLEICHLWYPCEYSSKRLKIGLKQVYVPIIYFLPYRMDGTAILFDLIYEIFYEGGSCGEKYCCNFTFDGKFVVKLEGDFLDDVKGAETKIKQELARHDIDQMTVDYSEELIQFLYRITS